MGFEVGGVLGLLILIADVYALVKIFQSRAPTGTKVLWIVLIIILPLVGVVLWYFMGPK